MDRTWFSRRAIAVALLVPGYIAGWLGAQVAPFLLPFLDWRVISPYTAGAIASTVFNTVMWDYWVKLVYRFGGREQTSK